MHWFNIGVVAGLFFQSSPTVVHASSFMGFPYGDQCDQIVTETNRALNELHKRCSAPVRIAELHGIDPETLIPQVESLVGNAAIRIKGRCFINGQFIKQLEKFSERTKKDIRRSCGLQRAEVLAKNYAALARHTLNNFTGQAESRRELEGMRVGRAEHGSGRISGEPTDALVQFFSSDLAARYEQELRLRAGSVDPNISEIERAARTMNRLMTRLRLSHEWSQFLVNPKRPISDSLKRAMEPYYRYLMMLQSVQVETLETEAEQILYDFTENSNEKELLEIVTYLRDVYHETPTPVGRFLSSSTCIDYETELKLRVESTGPEGVEATVRRVLTRRLDRYRQTSTDIDGELRIVREICTRLDAVLKRLGGSLIGNALYLEFHDQYFS